MDRKFGMDNGPTEAKKGYNVREYYEKIHQQCLSSARVSESEGDKEKYLIKSRIIHNVLGLLQGEPRAVNLNTFLVIHEEYLDPFVSESHKKSDEGQAAIIIATYFNNLSK